VVHALKAAIAQPRSPPTPGGKPQQGLPRHRDQVGRNWMFSYLLFITRPADADRQRATLILSSYLNQLESVRKLQRFFPPAQINQFLLPVDSPPHTGWQRRSDSSAPVVIIDTEWHQRTC
jgi:hypothetical protein